MAVFFLIGMMGSGKSYWAQQLAITKGGIYVDLDKYIEQAEQKTIATIFAEEGEMGFRKKEKFYLTHLPFNESKTHQFIAVGGGAACFFGNMLWMNKNGITIFINEQLPLMIERVNKQREHRPALKNKSVQELQVFFEEKLKERMPYYLQAKHIVVGSAINKDHFLSIINEYE
ncbi:MAG: shikimate kinase [Chitinophagaceae bacterium]